MRVVALFLLTGCEILFKLEDHDAGVATTDVPVADAFEGPTLRVFVTSQQFPGALGGVEGADLKCQEAGAELPSPRDYLAWVQTENESILIRLNKVAATFDGGYVLPNGMLVAVSAARLLTDPLLRPIDITEAGVAAQPSSPACDLGHGVWTNIKIGGSVAGTDCDGWTSETVTGSAGNLTHNDGRWTDDPECRAISCDSSLPLYCIEY